MLSSQMRLLELNSERKARVITAVRRAKQHLFQYMGYIGAYLLIGGVDSTGAHLYEVFTLISFSPLFCLFCEKFREDSRLKWSF